MITRKHIAAVLATSAALLGGVGTGIAFASPDGDDDPGYNANGPRGFGTQYSLIGTPRSDHERGTRPAVAVDPRDGSSVTAVILSVGDGYKDLQLTRYDAAGNPVTSFGDEDEEGVSITDIPYSDEVDDILDMRILADGTIVVIFDGLDLLHVVRYSPEGELIDDDSRQYNAPIDEFECSNYTRGDRATRGGSYFNTVLAAARVAADGDVSALWDCSFFFDFDLRLSLPEPQSSSFVAQYAALGESERDHVEVLPLDGDYREGEDLELGPNGDPYALIGTSPDSTSSLPRGSATDQSTVVHVADGTLEVKEPAAGGTVAGQPIDLAVDGQGRPVVWTKMLPDEEEGSDDEFRGIFEDGVWTISRLTSSLTTDTSWGTGGTATLTDERLGEPFSGSSDPGYLTVRPGDKVLATGENTDSRPIRADQPSFGDAIIAGLTNTGALDTGFANNGFKPISYITTASEEEDADTFAGFAAFGEPKLQDDGRALVPHVTDYFAGSIAKSSQRIAPPPAENGSYVGVTRLFVPTVTTPAQPQRQPQATPSRPVTPSATPTICGRRAISLVRADVRGGKVKLTGLVGSAFYGKKVTIQTDPTAAKASRYTKTTTVTASKRGGSFSVFVKRPKRSEFKSVRYRATVGKAKSPALKLPQSLTSRSVKSAAGTITVKGRVKKSVLGKRNKVTIRRLVCGRYRTVARVKPGADGSYTATFKATKIRGVAFYRAEAVVQVRPGSKKYAIQYARAIAIRTTGQTG